MEGSSLSNNDNLQQPPRSPTFWHLRLQYLMTLHCKHVLSFFRSNSFSQLPHQCFTAIAFLSLSMVSLSVSASGCGRWYSCESYVVAVVVF